LSAILFDIAEEVGINDAPRQKAKLSRLLEKKLKGSNGLLIIDESDHLSYDALEELRILQESTQIGISLIGNHRVYTRLSGGNNQAHEFARLWSRIGKHFGFKGSLKADVLAIAKAWGLDMNNEKLMALVLSIGQKAGGLRSLTQNLRLASLAASSMNCPISYELLMKAQAEMKS
jgi:DNA transposition AAA+ family ATPase